jgi:hypothetical protein
MRMRWSDLTIFNYSQNTKLSLFHPKHTNIKRRENEVAHLRSTGYERKGGINWHGYQSEKGNNLARVSENSESGNRTRATSVRTRYPNHWTNSDHVRATGRNILFMSNFNLFFGSAMTFGCHLA